MDGDLPILFYGYMIKVAESKTFISVLQVYIWIFPINMMVLLDGPRYCGVTMSRYSQVARPESIRYNYWAHVSELPDMWPVVLKRRRCLIYSNYFRVRWISTDNPLETAIFFYVKSVPGKISMLSPWPNERWQLEFHKYLASKEVWKHFEYDIFIL